MISALESFRERCAAVAVKQATQHEQARGVTSGELSKMHDLAAGSCITVGWAIRALDLPPPANVGVPEGWKLVPVKASDAMLDAAHGVPRCQAKDETACGYQNVYVAMLAAAPSPPASAGVTEEMVERATTDADMESFAAALYTESVPDMYRFEEWPGLGATSREFWLSRARQILERVRLR